MICKLKSNLNKYMLWKFALFLLLVKDLELDW